MFRKLLVVTIALLLAAALIPVPGASAQVPDSFQFTNLDYAACAPDEYAVVSFTYTIPEDNFDYYHYWTLTNGRTGSFTEATYGPFAPVQSEIVTQFPILPVPADVLPGDTLTLRVDTIQSESIGTGPALAPPPGTVVETDTLAWTCGEEPAEEEEIPVPGCDVLINIPSTAVGGAFTADAQAYWTPGQLTNPIITIPAGKTAWAIGPDATGEYMKVLWGCDFLWVQRGTIGPNYDALWQGKPLPTTPVE